MIVQFMGCMYMYAFTKTSHISLVPIKLNMCGDTKLAFMNSNVFIANAIKCPIDQKITILKYLYSVNYTRYC